MISGQPNFTKFAHKTWIYVAMNSIEEHFWKFVRKGSFFQKGQSLRELLESVWNFLQNPYDNNHLTLGMLLHYLWKLQIQIFCRYSSQRFFQISSSAREFKSTAASIVLYTLPFTLLSGFEPWYAYYLATKIGLLSVGFGNFAVFSSLSTSCI